MRFSGIKACLMAMLLVPGVAHALDGESYLGFSTGFAVRQQQDPANDHVDGGEKVYLGFRFLGPLALELGYQNLGKYENETMEVRAASADMVFNADIRGMSIYFKAGLADWEETDLATGASVKGQDVKYGVGFNLAVDRHVVFRTELERFNKVGLDNTTNDPGTDMSLFSFGIQFRF